MNRKSQWSCLAVLVVLLLTTTMVAWSQPPDGQVTLKTFDDQIAEVQSAINDWDFRASLVRWLAFGIIALGALTTFIQTMNKPVIRAATAGLGLLVALGSGFKDFSFSGDPATLNASSTDARGLLADMRDKRRQYQRAQDVLQQDEINKQFLAKYMEFLAITKRTYTAPSKSSSLWDISSPVFAQGQRPDWLTKLPNDPRLIQRVGKGEARTLDEAKNASIADAYREIGGGIAWGAKVPVQQATQIGAAIDLAASQSEIVDTYYERDAARGTFRYFTWLRVNRAIATPGFLPRARIEQSSQVPKSSLPRTVAVAVSAKDPQDGSFKFHFRLVNLPNGDTDVTLLEIESIEDGSVGTTRWFFDVFVDDVPKISLPEDRYDDSRSKNRKAVGKSVVIPRNGASNIALKVTGYKPKDFQ